VAAFPVVINGRPWGVLTLYGESSDDFTDGEVSLLRELAETVGIGATMLRERRDRQKAESGLRQALRDKDNLMRELNHRVKNNLNLVSSLISLKDRQMHETVDLTDLRNWVDSIRSVHEQLMHSPDATTVVLDRYLSDVVRPLFHGDLFAGIVPELDLRVPRMVISSRNAVSLGLIVNELATNAVKYATEPGAGLHFSVELSGEASGPFRLEVANNGAPLPEAIDLADGQSLGLGLTLIVSLVQSLGGSISVDRAAGTRYVMEFPSLS
jgi:two-component sensor histidine kinase